MSQNFNFNGGPFGPPHGSMPNNFEPYSGNMVYTTQSSPMQQSFPQPWPGTPGWQNLESRNYGYGLPYQGQNLGGSGYFATQQQDYVPFDEGEDFYENEDDAERANGHESHNSARNEMGSGDNTPGGGGQLRSNTRSTNAVAPTMPEPKAQQEQALSNTATGDTTQKPTTDAGEQLAQLRAKLLAQQRKSATPTPTKSNSKPDKLNKTVAGGASEDRPGEGIPDAQARKAINETSLQTAAIPGAEDQSLQISQSSASVPSTSQTDVEGLLAEVKAGMEATSEQIPVHGREHNSTSLGVLKETSSKAKEAALPSNGQHRQNPNVNTPSSEASELGEIREDIPKSGPARQAPEPLSPSDETLTVTAADHKIHTNGKSSQPARDVEAKPANNQSGKPAAPVVQAKLSDTVRSGTASGTTSRPQHAAQPPQIDRDRSRPEPSHGSQSWDKDNRLERGQDYRPQGGADFNQRRAQESRGYPNVQERTTFERDRRYGDRDQQSYRSSDPGNTRAAVKDGRSVDAGRREAYDADSKTVARKSDPSESNVIAPKTPVSKDAENTNVANKSYGASDTPSQELTNRIDPSMFANQQVYEDIMDWLEVTDWNDVPYRTQALARHRKLKALDAQRAELEHEAQLELEQRSRSVRARSTLPVETGTSRSVFSPQVLRTTSGTAMAPPPLPLKETEDLGIKIKDLANPEMQATGGSIENHRIGKPPTNIQGGTTLAMKRQRADDVESKRPGRADKLPRLGLGDRSQERKTLTSPTIKDESLESRITRNNEPRSAGHNKRSRSPDRRHRSSSPITRRASDTGGYYNRSRGGDTTRSDFYSPNVSRNASPSRRNSGTRGLPLYQEPPRFDRDFESRIQYDRESEYQSNYRSRGSGRGRGSGYNNYRSGFKPYSNRGGARGRSNGSESLNLREGGQSRG